MYVHFSRQQSSRMLEIYSIDRTVLTGIIQNPKLSGFLEFARFLGKFIKHETNVTVSDFRISKLHELGYVITIYSRICVRRKLMNRLTRT